TRPRPPGQPAGRRPTRSRRPAGRSYPRRALRAAQARRFAQLAPPRAGRRAPHVPRDDLAASHAQHGADSADSATTGFTLPAALLTAPAARRRGGVSEFSGSCWVGPVAEPA